MLSNYCKICNLFNSCEKLKNCSCELFETNVSLKPERKQRKL